METFYGLHVRSTRDCFDGSEKFSHLKIKLKKGPKRSFRAETPKQHSKLLNQREIPGIFLSSENRMYA